MGEVMIAFERPASLSRAEMGAWVSERAIEHQPALTIGTRDGRDNGALVLRVTVDEDSVPEAEEELADLMMEMRLLGLRPTVVSPGR